MKFGECLEQIVDGGKARRLEWSDERTYITIKDAKLVLFKPEDRRFHPLIVSEGDIIADDWNIVPEDGIPS